MQFGSKVARSYGEGFDADGMAMARWKENPLIALVVYVSVITGGIGGSILIDEAISDPAPVSQALAAPTTTVQTARPTTTRRSTTTGLRAGPIVELTCPPHDAGPWDWYRAEYAARVTHNGADFKWATIDYGDGRAYTSHSIEDAEVNLLWHRYDSPGSYTVRLTITDTNQRVGTDSCRFSWEDTGVSSNNGCDPNYTGCVPIASDVDCAGGSGNGPAYARGPIQVVGRDIYDLDRDNDGWACE